MIWKKKCLILLFIFTFIGCKNNEELSISKIEILFEIDENHKDSVQSILHISLKPHNEDVFFPGYLTIKNNKTEEKAYLNKYDNEKFISSNLLDYYTESKKIKNEKDFELLQLQVNQFEFYLPNGQKLGKSNDFKIEKGTYKNIDYNTDVEL